MAGPAGGKVGISAGPNVDLASDLADPQRQQADTLELAQDRRKRRIRSHSSPDQNQLDSDTYPTLDGDGDGDGGTDGNGVGPSVSPSHGGADPTPEPSASSGSRDEGLTLRRREANRLAAQRFRSRKKGYQDSLEERIRVLEGERDGHLRTLGETPEASVARLDGDRERAREREREREQQQQHLQHLHGLSASASALGYGQYGSVTTSPEQRERDPIDVDVRVAALEAANRRLQDELKAVYEGNRALLEELEGWRRWDRDGRARYEDPRPPLPSMVMPPPPPFERASSITRAHPPPPTAFRLPPLRLGPGPTPLDGPLPSPRDLTLSPRQVLRERGPERGRTPSPPPQPNGLPE